MAKSKINYADVLKRSGGNIAGAVAVQAGTNVAVSLFGGNVNPILPMGGLALLGCTLLNNKNPILSGLGYGMQAPIAVAIANRLSPFITDRLTAPPAAPTQAAPPEHMLLPEGEDTGRLLAENTAGVLAENTAGMTTENVAGYNH